MFNRFINWLVPQTFINDFATAGENTMRATITPLNNGKFAITNRNGDNIAFYARARDARRGALRRGFVVA